MIVREFNPALSLSLILVACAFSACGGRNIHRGETPDPRVMVRGWTIPTQTGDTEAGDRGFEYGNTIVWEKTLIFGSRGEGVVALYPDLKRRRWSFKPTGGVQSEISADRRNLYFVASDGFLYSLEAENGKERWKVDLKNHFASKPVLSNGRLFVATPDDVVYAFDANTGKGLWTYRRRTAQTTTIRKVSTPLVTQSELVVGLSDGYLISLQLEEGTLKWEKKLHFAKKFNDIDAGPVLVDDRYVVPSYDGSLYALNAQGDVQWKYDAGGARSVAVKGSTIFLPSSSGFVYALDSTNAKPIWKFELDRGVPTEVLLTDRYVIFASSFQYIYALDIATGALKYRFNLGNGAGVSAPPAFFKETNDAYFLSMSGNLYQFRVRETTDVNAPFDPYVYVP